eukprot:Phypoly_transcript_06693.p1 GENE.Phypoly_transcript_06693~~Phypoly_transcript_06693.p1  ORF type:complete len:525 (+),score=42.67 Phypoly_transcript_06693:172-1746(+)
MYIMNKFTRMSWRGKVPFVFASLCILGSFLGIIVYSAFVHREGPIVDVNQFLGVLLSTLLLIFSTQTIIYLSIKRRTSKRMKLASLVVDCIVFVISFTLFLGYLIGHRGDGIAWCLILVLISILNVYILKRQYDIPDSVEQYGLLVGDMDEEMYENTKVDSTRMKIFLIINRTIKFLAILFLCLLLGGCWTLASGYHKYGPPGKFVHVKYEDGRSQRIHYLCEGPLTDRPTMWLEVGGGHTLCDFYGIQYFLTQNGYRSCIYDRPGFGWSDYMIPNQPYWYDKMIAATGERGPFVVGGWGAGGDITYPFISQNPHLVHSWVLMDVSGPNEEWNAAQYANNWTDAQTARYQQEQMSSRYRLFDIIRAIGTPFGIMSFFYAPDAGDFVPADKYGEFLWHTKLEKHWTSQYFMLVQETKTGSPLSNITNFPPYVPIVALSSYMNQSTICSQQKIPLNSSECGIAWKSSDFWYNSKKGIFDQLSDFSANPKKNLWIECEDCDLGFPVVKSEWTAYTLLQIFNNSSIND